MCAKSFVLTILRMTQVQSMHFWLFVPLIEPTRTEERRQGFDLCRRPADIHRRFCENNWKTLWYNQSASSLHGPLGMSSPTSFQTFLSSISIWNTLSTVIDDSHCFLMDFYRSYPPLLSWWKWKRKQEFYGCIAEVTTIIQLWNMLYKFSWRLCLLFNSRARFSRSRSFRTSWCLWAKVIRKLSWTPVDGRERWNPSTCVIIIFSVYRKGIGWRPITSYKESHNGQSCVLIAT